MVATAALIALAAGGEVWVNHPWSLATPSGEFVGTATAPPLDDVVLEVKDSGIQMRDGESVVSELRNDNRGDVAYSVNTQGGVGASYVDNKTGMVTVNNIYYGQ